MSKLFKLYILDTYTVLYISVRLLFFWGGWRGGASLVAQVVKNLPAMQETQAHFLGQEDLLENRMATHSSILAWRIPWTQRNLAGYSPWGHKESDTNE